MHKFCALVDANAFFTSCEVLFKPHLKNTPVVVLSNNDGNIISLNTLAKKYVQMGDPYFKIKDICKKHSISVFSSNYQLYSDLSRRVMKVLKRFSPNVEQYSVDEMWLDLSLIREEDLYDFCKNIKETVEREIGIPVSVSSSHTKVLCKLANRIAKKDPSKKGVHVLTNESQIDRDLQRFPIGGIWGIGKRSEIKLKMMGIKTAYDFKYYKNEKYIKSVLTKLGLCMKYELQGKAFYPIETKAPKKKSLVVSRSFRSDVYDKKELKEAISKHIESAVKKLRSQDSKAKSVTVFYYTNPYKEGLRHYVEETISFSNPSNDTFYFLKHTLNIVDKTYKHGHGYKKAGVVINNIIDNSEMQLDLFSVEPIDQKQDALNKTMDTINELHGPGTIKASSSGATNNVLRMLRKTPRYTTSWDELQKVG